MTETEHIRQWRKMQGETEESRRMWDAVKAEFEFRLMPGVPRGSWVLQVHHEDKIDSFTFDDDFAALEKIQEIMDEIARE